MIRRYGPGAPSESEQLRMEMAGSARRYRALKRFERIRDRRSRELLESFAISMPRDLASALRRASRARRDPEAMLGLKMLHEICPQKVLDYIGTDEEVMAKIGSSFYRYIHSSTRNPDRTPFKGVHFAAMHRQAISHYLDLAFPALQSFKLGKPVTVYIAVNKKFLGDTLKNGMFSPTFKAGTAVVGKSWRLGWGRYVALDPDTAKCEITGRGSPFAGHYEIVQSSYVPAGGLDGTFDVFPSVRNPKGGANIVEKDAGAAGQFGPASVLGSVP